MNKKPSTPQLKRPLAEAWPGGFMHVHHVWEILPDEELPSRFRGIILREPYGDFLIVFYATFSHPTSSLIIRYFYNLESNEVMLDLFGLEGATNREIQQVLPLITQLRGEKTAGAPPAYGEGRIQFIAAAWKKASEKGVTQEDFAERWDISARTLRRYLKQADK